MPLAVLNGQPNEWSSKGLPRDRRHENESTTIVAILDHNKGSMSRNGSSKRECDEVSELRF